MKNPPIAATPVTLEQKSPHVISLDEFRRRQMHEARQRAYWAGRTLASRHSTRKAA